MVPDIEEIHPVNLNDKMQFAQWLLEKQLAWIKGADAKIAVAVTLDIGVFAVLATAYASAKSISEWATLLAILSSVFIALSLFAAAMSLFPRVDGPRDSLIFFGTISSISSEDYKAKLDSIAPEGLHTDIVAQVHRNAEIANAKHTWVRRSMGWSFMAALPWIISTYLLVKP